MIQTFRNCPDSVYHRTSRRRMQVVPNHGQWVVVCSHLHHQQSLEGSYLLLEDSRQSQLYRPTLVIILLLYHTRYCFTCDINIIHPFLNCFLQKQPPSWTSAPLSLQRSPAPTCGGISHLQVPSKFFFFQIIVCKILFLV